MFLPRRRCSQRPSGGPKFHIWLFHKFCQPRLGHRNLQLGWYLHALRMRWAADCSRSGSYLRTPAINSQAALSGDPNNPQMTTLTAHEVCESEMKVASPTLAIFGAISEMLMKPRRAGAACWRSPRTCFRRSHTVFDFVPQGSWRTPQRCQASASARKTGLRGMNG